MPSNWTLLSGFHAVFKDESSMTAILPNPLPAHHTPLVANSPARTEKPNLPSSRPPIPLPSTSANSRRFLPTRPPTSHPEFQPKHRPRHGIVSPRKEPPTSSVQIRRLQGEPTEPPKQTLNGRNQPLNGAHAAKTVLRTHRSAHGLRNVSTPRLVHQKSEIRNPKSPVPPTSSVQIRRLRAEPTEPPKQTLNGRNQPLNGAQAAKTVPRTTRSAPRSTRNMSNPRLVHPKSEIRNPKSPVRL
jgi:hypothetical protein